MTSGVKRRNILVAAFGLTPQVITETLYYLTQVKVPPTRIDEIRIITTSRGKQQVIDVLLAGGRGMFYQFCSEYGIDAEAVKFDEGSISLLTDARGLPLSDIRTPEENQLAADQIISFIRKLTSNPGVSLHCSVAGGRKTMGIYLAYALQLFGRPQDTLFHVLVSEELESHPDFFYKPREDRVLIVRNPADDSPMEFHTRDARIELAEIPYIRLRNKLDVLFGIREIGYTHMVSMVQRQINLFPTLFDLEISLRDRTVRIGHRVIDLQPVQVVIYAHYARNKLLRCRRTWAESCWGCTSCFIPFRDTSREKMLEELLGDYCTSYGGDTRVVQRLMERNREWKSGIPVYSTLRPNVSKINRRIREVLADPTLSIYYVISSEGKYGDARYGLKLDRAKIKVS